MRLKFLLFAAAIVGGLGVAWRFSAPRSPVPPKRITLVVDSRRYHLVSASATVEDMLREEQFRITPVDRVYPDPSNTLKDRMVVYVHHPYTLTLSVDGTTRHISTHARTVGALLNEERVALGKLDEVAPPLETPLSPLTHIRITRIEEFTEKEKTRIAFPTVVRDDRALLYSKTVVTQEGRDGEEEVTYRIRAKNGVETSRTILARRTLQPAKAKIVRRGTKIVIGRTQRGIASWYAFKGGLTAASATFLKNSFVRVRNIQTGAQIIVQINDYGPSPSTGRIIDLDRDAFQKLAPLSSGLTEVIVEEILT